MALIMFSPTKLMLSLILLLITSAVKPITSREQPICVPSNTCILKSGIDPRIMTPLEDKCPNNQERCLQYQAAIKCGYTYSNSGNDGSTQYGSHPYLAYITNKTGYAGAGVLLDRYHVLTAAHKIFGNKDSLQNLQVFIGVHNIDTIGSAYKRKVQDVIIHQNYDPVTLHNDIAVLRLKAHIPVGYQKNIGTACLPKRNERFVGKRCIIAGWGSTNFDEKAPTHIQKQVTVPIVTYERCLQSMTNVLGTDAKIYLNKNGEICAGGEPVRDACTGDGGAPLICKDNMGLPVIAGLVIWGKNCGQPNVYGVYADVPKYVDWINRAVRRLQN